MAQRQTARAVQHGHQNRPGDEAILQSYGTEALAAVRRVAAAQQPISITSIPH
jgi:hypothetical protein